MWLPDDPKEFKTEEQITALREYLKKLSPEVRQELIGGYCTTCDEFDTGPWCHSDPPKDW